MTKSRAKSVLSAIGIGASAGGVSALKELIPNLPKGRRLAYLVTLHLDPKHRSMLVDVLERETPLDVKTIAEGDKLRPDTIYVTPADRDCAVDHGKLHLQALAEPASPRHSIDIMLSSLAESYGELSAGIILSGTGSDGLHGAKAIKTAGGIAIAQDPETTQYPGMPEAVIEAGLADLVLPPAAIGDELEAVLRRGPADLGSPSHVALPEGSLDALLTVLSKKSPFDFGQYKESTLARRVQRRMAVHKADTVDDYIAAIEQSDTEAGLLVKEMLISVTGFFRDENTFGVISNAVEEIVRRKVPGEDIRIWVPGCATGEEPYSIAILLAEALGQRLLTTPVNIFASDVDNSAITFARQGIYLNASVQTIPKALLEKYFTGGNGVYQVGKTIRDMIVFARHDLIRDPPYIGLDLLSCRNVLIYFKRSLQERLIPVFHYALNSNGFLVVGTSEGIGNFTDLFEQFVVRAKVFVRTGEQRSLPTMPVSVVSPVWRRFPDGAAPQQDDKVPFIDLYRDLVTKYCAPPGVLVNGRFEIVHVQGDVTRFVQVSSGDLNLNIINMAVAPLRLEARLILRKAQRERTVARGRPIEIDDELGHCRVTPTAVPVTAGGEGGGHILLLFEEHRVTEPDEIAGSSNLDGNDVRISALERELAEAREHLQSTIWDLETSNENLVSINEEYQSTAEELQSANEELQAANEELQSANEELHTVNDELKAKSDDLATTNRDLENILNTVVSGVIVLDHNLRVIRYSTSSKQIFDLWPASIGASLAAVGSPFDLTPLSSEIEKAMRSRQPVERDLALGERIFSVLLVPLHDEADMASGLVIAFNDETERKRAEYQSRRMATVVRDSNDAITILDLDGRILEWNSGAERIFGHSKVEAVELSISDLVPEDQCALAFQLIERLANGETLNSVETKRRTKDGRELEIWLTATLLRDESGKPVAVATTERDLSESRRLSAATEDAVRANQSKSEFLARMSHDFRTPLNAIIGFSEIIKEEMFGPVKERRYVEYGKHIHTSGAHLLALVNDLLDISKIEAGEFELDEEVLDLRELANESVGTLRLQAQREGISLEIDAAANLPKVLADRRAIRQILYNLLANAMNFTATGGQVVLGLHRDHRGGLKLTVSDTGIGIAEEDIPTILAPFGQLPSRLGTKKVGAGLGLPIVNGLSEALGAEFCIDSEVDRGTTVTIRFGKGQLAKKSARR